MKIRREQGHYRVEELKRQRDTRKLHWKILWAVKKVLRDTGILERDSR